MARTKPIQVFVSYHHADAVYAKRLKENLDELSQSNREKEYDPVEYETWIDQTAIVTGADWRQAILSAIRSCDVVILLASKAHYSSYVAIEIGMALGLEKPILPFYTDSPKALELYHLGHLQGDVFPEPNPSPVLLPAAYIVLKIHTIIKRWA